MLITTQVATNITHSKQTATSVQLRHEVFLDICKVEQRDQSSSLRAYRIVNLHCDLSRHLHESLVSPGAKSRRKVSKRSSFVRRVKSTPDPDTFEKCYETPPISKAVLCKSMSSSLLKVANMHHQLVSRYDSQLYRNTFAEALGSGVFCNTPKFDCECSTIRCHAWKS